MTYTPIANVNGSNSFMYHVHDGTLDTNVATVSLTINAVNDTPNLTVTITGDDGNGSVIQVTFALTVNNLPSTATLDWGDGSPVEPGNVNPAQKTVSGSHRYQGTDIVTITVCVTDKDGGVVCDTLLLTIEVGAPSDPGLPLDVLGDSQKLGPPADVPRNGPP